MLHAEYRYGKKRLFCDAILHLKTEHLPRHTRSGQTSEQSKKRRFFPYAGRLTKSTLSRTRLTMLSLTCEGPTVVARRSRRAAAVSTTSLTSRGATSLSMTACKAVVRGRPSIYIYGRTDFVLHLISGTFRSALAAGLLRLDLAAAHGSVTGLVFERVSVPAPMQSSVLAAEGQRISDLAFVEVRCERENAASAFVLWLRRFLHSKDDRLPRQALSVDRHAPLKRNACRFAQLEVDGVCARNASAAGFATPPPAAVGLGFECNAEPSE